MLVKHVSVEQFRNLENDTIFLDTGINIFKGENGQGKTNFLEALYFSATGRSHRTSVNREMIHLEKDFSHITTEFVDYAPEKLDIHLLKNGKTGARLNQVILPRLGDLLGILHVVLFAPEDLSLLKDGPAVRRRFLDLEICQLSALYYTELQQYYKVLGQRNALLKQFKKAKKHPLGPADKNLLSLWDEQLVYYGQKIFDKRLYFIQALEAKTKVIHENIAKETFTMSYAPSVSKELFLKKLTENHERDVFLGSTSTGIHRDDLLCSINGRDARSFSSQGQVRTAALSIKLAEIQLIKEKKRKNPILLLDDVFSELDEKRQMAILEETTEVQTIITCTGIESIMQKKMKDASFFEVKDGKIKKLILP